MPILISNIHLFFSVTSFEKSADRRKEEEEEEKSE